MPKQSKQVDKNDPEYLKRRQRNNEAIRKSREKAKVKASETTEKVEHYKKDNKRLEDKISVLGQEMQFLKDIFLAHAGTPNSNKASQAAAVAADVATMKTQPEQEHQELLDSLIKDLERPGPSTSS